MSLLKLFEKARSTSAATSQTAVEADSQSHSGELSAELDKFTDSDDLASDQNLTMELMMMTADDDNCDESVPLLMKKVRGAECGDVATYIGKSQQLSNADGYQVLVNHFRPSVTFKFPRSANGCSFQHRWLQQDPQLCYSKQENGGVCLPCILFASGGYHVSDPGFLVHRLLTSFAKALESFCKHAATTHHKLAIVRVDDFKKVMENQQPAIQHLINQTMADRVPSNCQKLVLILKFSVVWVTEYCTAWPP